MLAERLIGVQKLFIKPGSNLAVLARCGLEVTLIREEGTSAPSHGGVMGMRTPQQGFKPTNASLFPDKIEKLFLLQMN